MRQKHYLEAAPLGLVESCPGQSRYLLCWFWITLELCLKPKAKLTPKIQKLLHREARNHALSFKEAKVLRKYKDSTSVLLVTCRTCNRTVKHHGKSRSFLSALKSNAATAANKANLKTPNRKTPGSTHPHLIRKNPSLTIRTPASGQSTPICSSRNGSKRKKHFSQLKALLSQSASENPKLDFMHFLSSIFLRPVHEPHTVTLLMLEEYANGDDIIRRYAVSNTCNRSSTEVKETVPKG
ncbi:hypothetical protein A6R68_13236 [Neotoma lepida]|uniref:Uncharacterized protein n=1 Tax=Neotoma lepida TaxID=56216 RepID=A0A1A6H1P5_NEOLE|nr:hypothetical protein A6R68_13236 [Neotoma lepida]